MSTQFSTFGNGINDVGGQLDEMLKKLGMSAMESAAPIQPYSANQIPFPASGNNSFISSFMQPTMQPAYMNLNYNTQPQTFQSGPLTDQTSLMPLAPNQSSINLQNVSESLASLQYSLSNMISMSNLSTYPLQTTTMLGPGIMNGNNTLPFPSPPLANGTFIGTNHLDPSTLGYGDFDSSGFIGTNQIDSSPLGYGEFDEHLVDGPPGLNDLQNNNDFNSNGVPFEFNEAPSHVQLEINSLLDGSTDNLASSLLMEGLFDQELAEETVSTLNLPANNNNSNANTGTNNSTNSSKKGSKSPQKASSENNRSEANRNSNNSNVSTNEQPVQQQTVNSSTSSSSTVAPVISASAEPEKPAVPKPFSWADITKTTAAPTTVTPPVVASTSPTPVVTSTTTPTTTTNNNNKSNNNNKNNNNNSNTKSTANATNNSNTNKAQTNNNSSNNNNNSNNNTKNNTNNNSNNNSNGNNNKKNEGGDKTKKALPVIDNLDLSHINSPDFDCNPAFAKFFVIKSYSEDDIHKSIKYGIWTSTESGNKRLDRGYRECAGKGPVYLFFSVNSSGQFCGLAEMTSPLDYSKKASCWNEDKWSGQFTVKWKIIKDIQNVHLRHVKLVNNENKPVTNSRDTQEVFFQPGLEVLQVFHRFQSKNSILDDFSYYNQQEKEVIQTKGQPTSK